MTTPPGWYDDPYDGHLIRWWDGQGWSGSTRARPVATYYGPGLAPPRPPLGRGWFGLSTALETTLRFLVLSNVCFAVLDLWGLRMFDSWLADPTTVDMNDADLFDTLTLWGGTADALLSLTCLVLMIIWLYRGHRSDRVQPDNLQHRSGWAIGGWFVPILQLWRPVQMVLDLRRGVDWAAPAGLVLWWWWTFLIGGVLQRAATALLPEESAGRRQYFDDLEQSLQLEIAACVVTAAAAVLGALVVRRTTHLVRNAQPAGAAAPAG